MRSSILPLHVHILSSPSILPPLSLYPPTLLPSPTWRDFRKEVIQTALWHFEVFICDLIGKQPSEATLQCTCQNSANAFIVLKLWCDSLYLQTFHIHLLRHDSVLMLNLKYWCVVQGCPQNKVL